jgi:hypothetical protein
LKDVIDKEVKSLLELKAEYKKVTGEDWKPDAPSSTPIAKTVHVCFSIFIKWYHQLVLKIQIQKPEQKHYENTDKKIAIKSSINEDSAQKKATR